MVWLDPCDLARTGNSRKALWGVGLAVCTAAEKMGVLA